MVYGYHGHLNVGDLLMALGFGFGFPVWVAGSGDDDPRGALLLTDATSDELLLSASTADVLLLIEA